MRRRAGGSEIGGGEGLGARNRKRLLGGRGDGGGWGILRGGGAVAVEAGLLFALLDILFGLLDFLVQGAVVGLFDGAFCEGAVYLGVALGAGVVLVVLVVLLLIFSGVAELVEDRVEAGLQAVV